MSAVLVWGGCRRGDLGVIGYNKDSFAPGQVASSQ